MGALPCRTRVTINGGGALDLFSVTYMGDFFRQDPLGGCSPLEKHLRGLRYQWNGFALKARLFPCEVRSSGDRLRNGNDRSDQKKRSPEDDENKHDNRRNGVSDAHQREWHDCVQEADDDVCCQRREDDQHEALVWINLDEPESDTRQRLT